MGGPFNELSVGGDPKSISESSLALFELDAGGKTVRDDFL
jgi:hypothetical protein